MKVDLVGRNAVDGGFGFSKFTEDGEAPSGGAGWQLGRLDDVFDLGKVAGAGMSVRSEE